MQQNPAKEIQDGFQIPNVGSGPDVGQECETRPMTRKEEKSNILLLVYQLDRFLASLLKG